MRRLHAWKHAKLFEAGNIRRVEHLGVLDAEPCIARARGVLLHRLLIGVQDNIVAAVSDGMSTKPETRAQGPRT